MPKFLDLMIMIGRFFAMTFGIAMNMKRITSTESTALDDLMFILSIIIGFVVGIYWNTLAKIVNKK